VSRFLQLDDLVGDATTSASAACRARFENLACPQLGAAFASLTAFEPMGDSQCCWIRPGMRGPSAHQLGFRIDLESDGDQRQYKNDDNGSHGPVCRTRIRRNTGALTLGRPPVSPALAGCHVPVDRRHRRAPPARPPGGKWLRRRSDETIFLIRRSHPETNHCSIGPL
jgi:hypothetical protein